MCKQSDSVILLSGEEKIRVDRKTAGVSTYIRNILRNIGPDKNAKSEDSQTLEIPINNVDTETLKIILKWCEHFKDTNTLTADTSTTIGTMQTDCGRAEDSESGQDIESEDRMSPIDPWDRKFLNVDAKTLQCIIMAANFLDIKPLLNVSCKLVAELLRGKSPEEIINAFKAC